MPKLTKYEKILAFVFLFTLPLVNPWVRGDGVGYYALARAPLIEHRLDFRADWLNANPSFRIYHTDREGNILRSQFTATGHLDNHFAVGPAILWAPFLVIAHAGVLAADAFGGHIPADGFSRPYVVAMAFATALYGFLALLISFRIARQYAIEKYAFIATVAIWFASSLPVYMYFNPSWSHAVSAFIVAAFLWYWLQTRSARTLPQWIVLGAIGGLMMDVYYVNIALLLLPLAESIATYYQAAREGASAIARSILAKNVAFSAALLAAFAPTLITKKIIYGSFLNFGYGVQWYWSSPAFLKAAFSADHGFFTWTPILFVSVVGLFFLLRGDWRLALGSIGVFLLYLYVIGCYEDWDGLSSFGNRFFVSLTPIYVIGLAAFFGWLAQTLQPGGTWIPAGVSVVFIALNFGLIFQWGTHLIPARGPISLRVAAYNEVTVVPVVAIGTVKDYLTGRRSMMERIEEEDVRQLKGTPPGETP